MTTEIALSGGHIALVDDEDADLVLSIGGWYRTSDGYAMCAAKKAGKKASVRMHRLIMRAAPGTLVDHINGNGLDNRKSNLRFANRVQNAANTGPKKNNKSGYKGVSRCGTTGRWMVQIKLDGRKWFLGRYDDPAEAAAVYERTARAAHGDFARMSWSEGGGE